MSKYKQYLFILLDFKCIFLEYIWPAHRVKAKYFVSDMEGCAEVVQ